MVDHVSMRQETGNDTEWTASNGQRFTGSEFELLEDWAARGAEIERLREAICEWAKEHSWGHPDWKKMPCNKVLFDIANEVAGGE